MTLIEEEGFLSPRLETDGFRRRMAAEPETGDLALPPISAKEYAAKWKQHLLEDHGKKESELEPPPDVKDTNQLAQWIKEYHGMDHQMAVEMRGGHSGKQYAWDTFRIRDQVPHGAKAHAHEPTYIYKAFSMAGNKHAECSGTGRVDCAACKGQGNKPCPKCGSRNFFACDKCGGLGAVNNEVCDKCKGMGGVFCEGCNGHGVLHCKNCKGEKNFPCKGCGGTGTAKGWRLESPIQTGNILPKGTFHFGCKTHNHTQLPLTSECGSGIYGYLDPEETRDTELRSGRMDVLTKGLATGDILPRDLGAAPANHPNAVSYDPTATGVRGVKVEDFTLHGIEHPRCETCQKPAAYVQGNSFRCVKHKSEGAGGKPLAPMLRELRDYYDVPIMKDLTDPNSESKLK